MIGSRYFGVCALSFMLASPAWADERITACLEERFGGEPAVDEAALDALSTAISSENESAVDSALFDLRDNVAEAGSRGDVGTALALASRSERNLSDSKVPAYYAHGNFRIAVGQILSDVGCIKEAESYIGEAANWPFEDTTIERIVKSAHAGLLRMVGRSAEGAAILSQLAEDVGDPLGSWNDLASVVSVLLNQAIQLRNDGLLTESMATYRRAEAVLLHPDVSTLADQAAATKDLLLYRGAILVNAGIAALHMQDTALSEDLLGRAFETLTAAGPDGRVLLIDWYRVAADLAVEKGDDEEARELLERGLAEIDELDLPDPGRRADLELRLSGLGSVRSSEIDWLRQNEAKLERSAGSSDARARNATALADAYRAAGDLAGAEEWSAKAVARRRSMSVSPNIELAIALTYQSQHTAAPLTGQAIYDAYQISREAIDIVDQISYRQSVGCLAGSERNRRLVATIREWHGIVSSTLLQVDGVASSPIERDIAESVFRLVQAHEIDRFGVVARRSALRAMLADPTALRRHEDAMRERCVLTASIDAMAVGSAQRRDALLDLPRALSEIDALLETSRAALPQGIAMQLATGRQTLSLEELERLLRPGEALLAFRFGDENFGVASLSLRQANNLVNAIIPLPNGESSEIGRKVTSLLEAIATGFDTAESNAALSHLIRLDELVGILEDTEHLFVALDDDLRRLPSHMLPVGTGRLGDYVPSSTVASIWSFAARRQIERGTSHSSGLFAVGDPVLHGTHCGVIPYTGLHRDVMCLSRTGGLTDWLQEASTMLGGPPPLLGEALNRSALNRLGPIDAGILLFGTHGVVPETHEIAGLTEAALVLTPDLSDPSEDGLLLSSQIAELPLDQGWLAILAACRTGVPTGTDVSDGLTGLAIGFASAGVETLLATQWQVEPEEVGRIVLATLSAMQVDPSLTVSAALEKGMRELANEGIPASLWAAFTVIGDGTMTMPQN